MINQSILNNVWLNKGDRGEFPYQILKHCKATIIKTMWILKTTTHTHEKATSNIEFPGKKFLSLKEKNLHDNQKQQNDGEPAHILISIWGNPVYYFGSYTTIYSPF